MAVIGNSATQQAFTPAVDYFSGNGSTTAFTLSRPVASVAQVEAVIDNVVQNPSSAYTVSGNTITFTSAPLSGTNNIYVRYTSPITQVIAPGQGTVNTTALGNITNIASGNSSLTLQTGSGNTTAVTIDTSQNVGIGTSSPATKLAVNGGSINVDRAVGGGASQLLMTLGASSGGNFGQISNTGTYWALGYGSSQSTVGTQSVVWDSSGNVGIGTSSPASKLDINTGASTGTTDMITLGGLDNASTKQTYGVIQMGIENNTASSEQGNILLQTVESGTVRTRININGSGYQAFSNGGTERMRIDSSGRLLVNGTSATTNTYVQVNVNGGNGAQGWMAVMCNGSNLANQQAGVYLARTNNYIQSTIDGAGNFRDNVVAVAGASGGVQLTSGATSWSALSDERTKDIIEPITDATNKIATLRTVIGKYKNDSNDKRRAFLIAQDVQAVLPEAVVTEDEGQETEKLLLSYTDVIPLLVASIKELKALVDAQATEIAELKAKVGV